jgi:hypothetical protein
MATRSGFDLAGEAFAAGGGAFDAGEQPDPAAGVADSAQSAEAGSQVVECLVQGRPRRHVGPSWSGLYWALRKRSIVRRPSERRRRSGLELISWGGIRGAGSGPSLRSGPGVGAGSLGLRIESGAGAG